MMNVKIQPASAASPTYRIWTTLDLITWTRSYFEKKGIEHARLEAELLLAEVLGCARIRLYVDFEKPVGAEQLARFREYVKRRGETREPLQYILGHTQFLDLKIKVTPAALIPRPETEILAVWAVERALEMSAAVSATACLSRSAGEGNVAAGTAASETPSKTTIEEQPPLVFRPRTKVPKSTGAGVSVLELCTGSGCIALYMASKLSEAHIVATDISKEALDLARENATALKLDARVEFLNGDLFGALSNAGGPPAPQNAGCPPAPQLFDLIVANPPYVDEASKPALQPEVRDFEPPAALYGGSDGTSIIRRILNESAAWLKPGGYLGLEFGAGQAERILQIAQATKLFIDLKIESDAAKLPRFLLARTKA
ncbi:MAG TPA: HemK/PrmC family methyltransferase [Planctomycetota bacterium]|nr:HemK/PrmC family methyltransferase [Planctomycetota bacterium]